MPPSAPSTPDRMSEADDVVVLDVPVVVSVVDDDELPPRIPFKILPNDCADKVQGTRANIAIRQKMVTFFMSLLVELRM